MQWYVPLPFEHSSDGNLCVQYTPADSLVFGGNFLHSLNIATQLELHRIEIATKVPKKFRFPMFITLRSFPFPSILVRTDSEWWEQSGM
jgi:hypothetical protein